MKRALLLGCGNIGAMYDIDSENVYSHAKMYYLNNIKVDFIEPDKKYSDKVQKSYGFNKINTKKDIKWSTYDYVSICTPTSLHYEYLKGALENKIPIIICEKPISYSLSEINSLKSLYQLGSSFVLVNYIRRFNKNYKELKQQIDSWGESLKAISCVYYKGIMNYASHALDTINYLTNWELDEKNTHILNKKNDYFKEDPTISFSGIKNDCTFQFLGLQVNYPILELELYFESYKILLIEGGRHISIYKNGVLEKVIENALSNYMNDVYKYADKLYKREVSNDNFTLSLNLNQVLINLINK